MSAERYSERDRVLTRGENCRVFACRSIRRDRVVKFFTPPAATGESLISNLLATRQKTTSPLMARISPFTTHFSPFTSDQNAVPLSNGKRLAQSPPNSLAPAPSLALEEIVRFNKARWA